MFIFFFCSFLQHTRTTTSWNSYSAPKFRSMHCWMMRRLDVFHSNNTESIISHFIITVYVVVACGCMITPRIYMHRERITPILHFSPFTNCTYHTIRIDSWLHNWRRGEGRRYLRYRVVSKMVIIRTRAAVNQWLVVRPRPKEPSSPSCNDVFRLRLFIGGGVPLLASTALLPGSMITLSWRSVPRYPNQYHQLIVCLWV